jgi:hypothetical protein
MSGDYKTEDGAATPRADQPSTDVGAPAGSAAESATGARNAGAAPSSQVSRQEAGQTGKGGDGAWSSARGTGDHLASPTQGEQASGALLARHLPFPVFADMLFDALHVVRARQITAHERRAVDDCITAVRDLLAKFGGRTEDR